MRAFVKTFAAVLAAVLLMPAAVRAEPPAAVVYHVEEDFSGLADGVKFADYGELKKEWTADQATQYETVGAKGSLYFGPFAQLILNRRLTGPYVFTSSVKAPNNQYFGVFVRSTGEYLSGVTYYEHDGITTESGDADNEGIGATGIYVMPRADRLMLCVKTADSTQPKGIGTDKTYFDLETDFSAGFTALTFTDDGETVAVSVADKPVCTVEMSGRSETDFMSSFAVFTKAVIRDPSGNTVKTVENCRISADFSVLAYGMRINHANVDDISVTEYEKKAPETEPPLGIRRVDIKCQPEKYEYLLGEELDLSDTFLEVTYENGVKEDVKVTPDMVEGFDSSKTGSQVLTVRYAGTSAAYSVFIVEEYGQSTAGITTGSVTYQPENTEADDGGKGVSRNTVVIAAAAVGAVIFGGLIAAVVKGKKKDGADGKEEKL